MRGTKIAGIMFAFLLIIHPAMANTQKNNPDSAMADHLMDELSAFVESNTDAEVLEESRELR